MKTRLLLLLLLLAGCKDRGVEATVSLTIDGAKHDYTTRAAETDRHAATSPLSVYLLREDGQEGPTLSLRYFSGNPVAQLTLRGAGNPGRYECFVPGTLSDGRQTLGWKTAEGKDRSRQETGDEGCSVTVSEVGDTVELRVHALMTPIADKKAKESGEAPPKVAVEAQATVKVR